MTMYIWYHLRVLTETKKMVKTSKLPKDFTNKILSKSHRHMFKMER